MTKYTIFIYSLVLSLSQSWGQTDKVLIPLDDPTASKELKINIFQGEIKVSGTDRQDVEAFYEVITNKDDEDTDEGGDHQGLRKISGGNLDLQMSSEDNVVAIQSQNWNKNIMLNIQVPRDMDVNIQKNIGGSVSVSDVRGTINIENNIGDVITKNIDGVVNASTNAGKLEIHFASIPTAKNMMFTSTTGSVDVTLPSQFDVDLILKTDMGEIYSDLDLIVENKVQPPASEKKEGVFKYSHRDHTYAKVGAGGPEITIISKLGSIYLRQGK